MQGAGAEARELHSGRFSEVSDDSFHDATQEGEAFAYLALLREMDAGELEVDEEAAQRQQHHVAASGLDGSGRAQRWRDLPWLLIFVGHLGAMGYLLVRLGKARFHTERTSETQDFWPMYGMAAGVGLVLAWAWLFLLWTFTNQCVKVAIHSVSTYLAVISVFCFWDRAYFWGSLFAIGALLQFLYALLAFTMLVLRKAVGLVRQLPGTMWTSLFFAAVLCLWLVLWSFGVSAIVSNNDLPHLRDWIVGTLSLSLFWTGAVLCNTVHVVVADVFILLLKHNVDGAPPMPKNPTLHSVGFTLALSLGSICYGSLFTAAIRMLRWVVRGLRARCAGNECCVCCVDLLFNAVETLVRFFNKYGFVEVGVHRKGFNRASCDVWELFQSTGMEALVAYDLSGAVLLMGAVLGGLLTGTSVGCWAWFVKKERVVVVGATSMLMGMLLIGITLVVVESAVTSIYVSYAEDPTVIGKVDAEFAAQLAEALHQRLQHRSGRPVFATLASAGLPAGVPKQ
eukprot:SM000022S07139  [mRNA]  locus=s22:91528:94773:- [translate_table: standard]